MIRLSFSMVLVLPLCGPISCTTGLPLEELYVEDGRSDIHWDAISIESKHDAFILEGGWIHENTVAEKINHAIRASGGIIDFKLKVSNNLKSSLSLYNFVKFCNENDFPYTVSVVSSTRQEEVLFGMPAAIDAEHLKLMLASRGVQLASEIEPKSDNPSIYVNGGLVWIRIIAASTVNWKKLLESVNLLNNSPFRDNYRVVVSAP